MSSRPNLLPPTAEDTIGPYYPMPSCDLDRSDLVRTHEGLANPIEGQRLLLSGRVLDMHGDPVKPFLIEFAQADANGRRLSPATLGDPLIDPRFTGHGRQYVQDGTYRILTIRPGPTPSSAEEAARAPHITVTIFCDGITRVVTQLFFADAPENRDDPLLMAVPEDLRARLIATREPDGDGAQVYRRDIVLRGADETPFFDDLES